MPARRALVFVLAIVGGCTAPRATAPAAMRPAEPVGLSREDAAFLDDVQERTFRWFWETANPANGLVPDRWPTPSFSSVAAVGFGLTAYPVGVERGWVPRDSAAARTLATLRFFWNAPQGPGRTGVTGHKGFFYHFLDMRTGLRFQDVELSTIDTALFLMGALAAAEYFDRETPDEAEIRSLADRIYRRVDWRWAQPFGPLVAMGWRPENGFIAHEYRGYNEAMLLYVLALGSPTYPIHEGAWDAYTATYHWADFEGYEHVNFAPLFGHQYSHTWLDFRGIKDAYMRAEASDYFENSRRATLAQIAYVERNPGGFEGYGLGAWGLSAVDGPKDTTMTVAGRRVQFQTYAARGAAAGEIRDDGTLAPTAAGGSMPFAPEEAIRALRMFRALYGDDLYTRYGFLDSVNPTFGRLGVRPAMGRVTADGVWVDGDHLGIDQGPILLMIENYRTGLVWRLMRGNEPLVRGLRRAGFTGGWLDGAPATAVVTAPAALTTGAPSTRIVVLGSSTAEGWGVRDKANAWAARYRAHVQATDPDADLINLAIGGYTTYHLLPTGTPARANRPGVDTLHNVTRALRLRPDALVVNLGSNDRAYGFTNAEALANFETIRRTAEAQRVPVWFTTTQPRDLDDAARADQAALRDSLRARYPGRVVDFWTGVALADGRLDPRWDSGDRLHLNDAGHAVLFERVRDARILETVRAR